MNSAYLKTSEELRENPGQWAAYESTGHCVVLAGPGSGKTKTLTIKLARMLADDVRDPRGIACITYSNECARELKRRLQALGVEERERRVFIGTIHSFSLKHIVAPFALAAGLNIANPIKVATADEQRKLFDAALTNVMGESARASHFKVAIDAYRRTHLDRNTASWNEDTNFSGVITNYEGRLRRAGLIDFDDLMLLGLNLVESYEWVRRSIVAKFPILAVDEYQDLGLPLHRIVMDLCFGAGARLFAVGDADQSIYSFAGARPELLKQLSEREDVTSVTLPFNYRSAPEIVAAGEATLGEPRGYTAKNTNKGIIEFHYFENGLEEQVDAIIADLIPAALKRDDKRRLGDVAIIYTDYNDGNLVSGVASAAGLKFVRIDSGAPIPTTPMIRWLQDCAEWCAGGWQRSQPKLRDLISSWFRFNPSRRQTSDRIELQRSLVTFLFANRDSDETLANWLEGIERDLLRPAFASEGTLRDEEKNIATLLKLTNEGNELENATLAIFSGKAGSPNHLNLITLHSAKGLEYEVVFLLGMDEGRLPSWADNTNEKRAEARRRFYVGLTRAKSEVHLTYSGFTENKYGTRFERGPSPFLTELKERI